MVSWWEECISPPPDLETGHVTPLANELLADTLQAKSRNTFVHFGCPCLPVAQGRYHALGTPSPGKMRVKTCGAGMSPARSHLPARLQTELVPMAISIFSP